MNTILLFLIGIPAIEIFVMIKIGQNIGAFNTIFNFSDSNHRYIYRKNARSKHVKIWGL